nr:uncharacterized protein LOC100659857 isoform X1 [Loxodonta africana]
MAARTFTARLYSLLFRRTSTFALTIAVGAVIFERAFDQGADAVYEHMNEGVRAWAVPDLGTHLRGDTGSGGGAALSQPFLGMGVNRGRLLLRLLPSRPGVNPDT